MPKTPMPSSQLIHPVFSSPPRNNNHNEEEKKEDEAITIDTASPQTNVITRSLSVFSKSTAHLNSTWTTLQQLYHSEDLQSQTQQTRFILCLLRDIVLEFSPQTQICLCLLSFGLILIIISLPTTIIIATIFLSIGMIGIISIITQKYIKFATERGLISLIEPSIIKRFIVEGSIVDIFYEIRNSNLGIPDFLLSQILPLDDPEREMIFERLPQITRNVVSTEGLIYLTPQYFQTFALPYHLQRNIHRSSTITDDNEHNLSLRTPTKEENNEIKDNIHGKTPTLLSNTKHEIKDFGMKWLLKHQEMDNKEENDDESSLSELSLSLSNEEEEEEEEVKVCIEETVIDANDVVNEEVSWVGRVSKLFSDKVLGGKNGLASKPVLKAVIDTRMKELVLQMLSYVWKSPFSSISDGELWVIFMCCVGCVSYYLTKNKKARTKFIKSIKYISFMVAFWMAILTFIELNIRKKSKVVKKIWKYINKQLFHSKHHRDLIERKKSHSDLKKSQSMRVYSEKSMSRLNVLKGIKSRRIQFGDKKSKFSRTMPFITSNNASPRSARSDDSTTSFSISDLSRLDLDSQPINLSLPIPSHMNRPKFKSSLTGIPDELKMDEINRNKSTGDMYT